jgi:uncharacterized membrane protein YccC
MAVMHINSVLGAYTLWGLISSPGVSVRPVRALKIIGAIGLSLVAALQLAGVLVQAPWIYLPFLGGAAIIFTYLINFGVLEGYWVYVEVLALGTFYDAIFTPYGLGWPTAYAFAGVALGIILLALFDMVLWPDPAERALCRSIAAGFKRNRARLAAAVRGYLDEKHLPELPSIAAVSEMPLHLPMLNRARAENPDSARHAELLAAVTTHERLFLDIGRIVVQARENVGRSIRLALRNEIETVHGALDAIIAAASVHVLAGLQGDMQLPAEKVEELRRAMELLELQAAAIDSDRIGRVSLAEISNLSAFVATLRAIADRVTHPPESLPPLPIKLHEAPPLHQSFPRDQARIRYCIKLGIAIVGVFIAGLTTQRPELDTIVWTALIVGLPTYGATLRKMALRLGGVFVGGAAAITAMIIISPNFTTIVAYVTIFFVALFFASYLGLSGGRINYLGKQAGTTFILAYATLAPTLDIYTPLWRLWAVLLSILITGAVFIALWPDYARNALINRLNSILKETLKVIPRQNTQIEESAIHSAAGRVITTLYELLQVANDARLEGRSSGVDAASIVDASGTLRRIGYNLAMISLERLHTPRPALEPAIAIAQSDCETEIVGFISYWLQYFSAAVERAATKPSALLPRPSSPPIRIGDRLRLFEEQISVALSGWPENARQSMLVELQLWRRIAQLAPELDSHLRRVRVS